MVLQRLPRQPVLDGIDLFRRLDADEDGLTLDDPHRVDKVVADVADKLREALATPTTVQGWRAQAMFSSLVAALDECDLMTFVDTGEIYYDGAKVKAPDFFLHLRSGRRLLVDVKSHSTPGVFSPDASVKFKASEVARLSRFAEMYAAELFFAIYFPEIATWILLAKDDFETTSTGSSRITVMDALRRNRLALLGDRTIGTVSPLELVLHVDPDKRRSVDEDGKAVFIVKSVELLAAGTTITDETEQKIAYFLMLYGNFPAEQEPIFEGGQLTQLRMHAASVEESGHGFEVVGPLSSMYARLFEGRTTGPMGVTALDISIDPGTLATLIPKDFDFAGSKLPLWVMELNPGED
ncbi:MULTISPECIES: hypothetical protein [unclassified Frondihabitans]|uniref:hypothetical protein n=1 Tax=unclassified Frondihabitans TaxID=2626248 RepID=UPI000F505C32|nr:MULTISPECIES: hypothetical protein [unclassified Frondihabitans]RPE77896.1 hypothetical protein EDF37_0564 [Frondihabitans sp. PhB153]RPF08176.1 hypothetical protein EDF39_0565 [Frondihabitans sp. PhB161]